MSELNHFLTCYTRLMKKIFASNEYEFVLLMPNMTKVVIYFSKNRHLKNCNVDSNVNLELNHRNKILCH